MITFTGSPEPKYSKAVFASSSANVLEMSGFKFTLPVSNNDRAFGYKLQYLYTPMMSISRLAASCKGTGVELGKFATTQTVPPEAAALMQVSSAAATPQHSKQKSNFLPMVCSIVAKRSGVSARKQCSTPISAALASFASMTSVMVTVLAPATLAHKAVIKPMGPAPLTSTCVPGPTLLRVTACSDTHIGSSIAPSSNETESGNL
mmetsp:Transcript_44440/g.105297  ORF Transcript_44440/g.105297 Transcript_44440/m.105297 type:complete len:205 (-) Transcript_44440:571-1185(-)